MLRHAMKAAELPEVDRNFGGMTAVVVGNDKSDIGAVAKVLKQFGKEFEKPKFKVGSLGKKALSADEISAVADLPSLDVLRAQLVRVCFADTSDPHRGRARRARGSDCARVLKAHADKAGEASAPARRSRPGIKNKRFLVAPEAFGGNGFEASKHDDTEKRIRTWQQIWIKSWNN